MTTKSISQINNSSCATFANRKNVKDYRLGELFCGPGGIALGASLAKVKSKGIIYSIKHQWANDYDSDTCETFKYNICPESKRSVVCKDVRNLKLSALAPIDAFAFGFPCNDFSVVGEQKGINGIYGPLYSYGVAVLKKFQPDWFLAENVGGLRNANDGNAFETILEELYKCGYDIVPHLYKFEKYGVPQARHRIIVIGIRKDIRKRFRIPAPFLKKPVTAKQALENPPIPIDAFNNELTNQSIQVIERLKHIKPGENAFTANLPKHLRLKVSSVRISQIYKRLDPSKPSYTVTGSGGGGTHVYHWKENRALTNRERARLQTFPDTFVFKGSKESVRKQIGMAVPPKGVQIIFEAVLKTLAGVPYPSISPSFPIIVHGDI